MENRQEQPAAAEPQRTSSVDCEPKTLTKEQYHGLARAAAAMADLELRINRESNEMEKEKEDSTPVKDLASSSSGSKFPA